MNILEQILNAVTTGLDALYPDIYAISEWVPNQLPARCFLIGFAGEPEISRQLGDRYKVSGQLDIAYYSPKKEAALQEELNEVFSKLSFDLQRISYQDISLRLHTHSRKVVDGVLHDICAFSTFLYKIDDTPTIGSITISEEADT